MAEAVDLASWFSQTQVTVAGQRRIHTGFAYRALERLRHLCRGFEKNMLPWLLWEKKPHGSSTGREQQARPATATTPPRSATPDRCLSGGQRRLLSPSE